jgi:hypothetical protein
LCFSFPAFTNFFLLSVAVAAGVSDDAGLSKLIEQRLSEQDETSAKLRQVLLKRVQAAISHPEASEFVVHGPDLQLSARRDINRRRLPSGRYHSQSRWKTDISNASI